MMLGKKSKRICVQCGTATAKKDRVRCKNCGCKIFGTVESSGNSPASSAASTPSRSPRQSKLSPLAMQLRSPRNNSVPGSPVYTPTRREMKNAKMVCAMCGRPTVKTDRKKCKTCGGTAFEPAPHTLSKEEKFGKSPRTADVGGDMDPVAAVEAAAADEEFLIATKFAATGVRPKEMARKLKPVKKEKIENSTEKKKTAAGLGSRLKEAEKSPSSNQPPTVLSLKDLSESAANGDTLQRSLNEELAATSAEVPASRSQAQDSTNAADSGNIVLDANSAPQYRQEAMDANVPKESHTEDSETEAVVITPPKAIGGNESHEKEVTPPPEKRSTTPDLPNHGVQHAGEQQPSSKSAQKESASGANTDTFELKHTRASPNSRLHSDESKMEAGSNSGDVGQPEPMPKGSDELVHMTVARAVDSGPDEAEDNITACARVEEGPTMSNHVSAAEPETRAVLDAHLDDTIPKITPRTDATSGQVGTAQQDEERKNLPPDDASSDDLDDLDEVEANRSTAPSEARRRRLSSTKTADVKCNCTIS